MRSSGRSPLRPVTPHRTEELVTSLRQENERLRSEVGYLKDLCASERQKRTESAEIKSSVESSLHQDLKQQAEALNRLRDELRKKEISNAEMAVKLSEQEQATAKLVEEYRRLSEVLNGKNEKLSRAEKEGKLLYRQYEERHRLMESLSLEKSEVLRDLESVKATCKELMQEKASLETQLKENMALYKAAMQRFGQDRDLLIWESASRTRVMASARVQSCLMQVFRSHKRLGFDEIASAAQRFASVRSATAVFFRTIERCANNKTRDALNSVKSGFGRSLHKDRTADWAKSAFSDILKRSVLGQWRVLTTRRHKCRIVLKLFLQATHKTCLLMKKGFLRMGLNQIKGVAEKNRIRLKTASKIVKINMKVREKAAFLRLSRILQGQAKKMDLDQLNYKRKALFGWSLYLHMNQHKDSISHFLEARKTEESRFQRKAEILQTLISGKELERVLGQMQLKTVSSCWRTLQKWSNQRIQEEKRVQIASNLMGKLKEERVFFVLGKCFLGWKDLVLRSRLDSLAQEVETEKPLRQYYQTTSQEFGIDLLKSKQQQAIHTLVTLLMSKVKSQRFDSFQVFKRSIFVPKKGVRKLVFLFKTSLGISFSFWRRQVYDLNLAGLCEEQAKTRLFNENLIEHVAGLEEVVEASGKERTELVQRYFGKVCRTATQNLSRNWFRLWGLIALKASQRRKSAEQIAEKLLKITIKTAFRSLFKAHSKAKLRTEKMTLHSQKTVEKQKSMENKVISAWVYQVKLKKIILKTVGKYSRRKELQGKVLGFKQWHKAVLSHLGKEWLGKLSQAEEDSSALQQEVGDLQIALSDSRNISEVLETTLLKLAKTRLIIGAARVLRLTFAAGFKRWAAAADRSRLQRKWVKKMIVFTRLKTVGNAWKLWSKLCAHSEKELRTSQIREAFAGQKEARQMLSEVEVQRQTDVTSLKQALERTEKRLIRTGKQVVGLVRREGERKIAKQDRLALVSWRWKTLRTRLSIAKLFRLTRRHMRLKGMRRLQHQNLILLQIHARTRFFSRVCLSSDKRVLKSVLSRWAKSLSKEKRSELNHKLTNEESRVLSLQYNLSSVKKKLHWKVVLSAKEKRTLTVLRAWGSLTTFNQKMRVSAIGFQAKTRLSKLGSALKSLKSNSFSHKRNRQLLVSARISYTQKRLFSAFSRLRKRAVIQKRVEKAGKTLDLKLRKRLERFSFNKIVRCFCVLTAHQRWKLRSGVTNFRRWFGKLPRIMLGKRFQRWKRTTSVWSHSLGVYRRFLASVHFRFLSSPFQHWKSLVPASKISTFTSVTFT